MPQAVDSHALAASVGFDLKRVRARRAVMLEYLTEHIFDADEEPDWAVVQRAVQCVDYQRPLWLGPFPAAPARLVAIESKVLGAGFFRKVAQPDAGTPSFWTINPAAKHLGFFAPKLNDELETDDDQLARYFVPFARHPKGKVVARPELG